MHDAAASKYTDVDPKNPNKINSMAQDCLKCLKNERIPFVLDSSNIRSYAVTWSHNTGIDTSLAEHENYLKELCSHVLSDVKSLIDKSLNIKQVQSSALHQDVLHHAKFCCSKCESFCGRESILDQIYNFMKSSNKKPLIIHGPSGSGKTSLMAKAASLFHTWMGKSSFSIVRFLGTSPTSSSIRSVLVSICLQLCSVFGITAPAFDEYNYLQIVQFFSHQLLETLPLDKEQHLGIFVDSIDQLSPSDGAHTFNWLPKSLPSNIHIIVSILPDEYNCLATIQNTLPFQHCYIEVTAMPQETGLCLMNNWLNRIGRKITSEQASVVLKAFSDCPQPLHLRLIFHQVQRWNSYTNASETILAKSIDDAMSNFFQSIEYHYGSTLVKRALGYITAARHGLSELELEDILSLDDAILDDVYQYWEPPVKGVVRIPSLVWKRIRFDISNYLAEQSTCGKTTLSWYHRQFRQGAEKRYLSERATQMQLHSLLSVFFEGIYSGGKGKTITLTHLGIKIDNANTQVAEQPLKFSERIYNVRKLSEMPFHMLLSGQIEKLKSISLCNFEWLHTKLIAMSLDSIMEDMALAISKVRDADIDTISETLSLSSASIKRNDISLAGSLIGRLHSLQLSSNVHQLLTQAHEWTINSSTNEVEIIPQNNCLIGPGGPLKTTLYGHPQVVLSLTVSFPIVLSCSKGPGCCIINIWDFSSIKCIQHLHTFRISEKGTPAVVIAKNMIFAICGHQMVIWDLNSKEEIFNYLASCELISLAATTDAQKLLAGTIDGSLYCYNVQQRDLTMLPSLHGKSIHFLRVHSDGNRIITAAQDGVLGIHELSSKRTIHLLNAHAQMMTCLLSEHIGNIEVIITGSDDKTAKVWDLINGNLIHTLCGHTKAVKCIAVANEYVITGSLDSTIIVWSFSSGSRYKTLEGHLADIWCTTVLPGGKELVSGSKDDYLKVWSIEEGRCLQTLEGHSSWVSCVATVPSSGLIISGSNDKSIKIWKHDSKSVLLVEQHLKQPECVVSYLALDLVISGAPDGIKFWKLSNGKCVHTISTPASCLATDVCNHLLISGTKDGTLNVWSLETFSMMHRFRGHSAAVTCLFRLSRESFISASADGLLKMWTCNLLERISYSGHTAGVKCLAVSEDEAIAASGSSDCTARIWSIFSGKCIGTLSGHTKVVVCIAISKNNSLIATGSDDTTLRVWSLHNLCCTHQFQYMDSVKCLLFTPDDKMVIAGAHCAEDQLVAWNIASRDRAINYIGHTHAVMCMLLMDRDHIITGSRDGMIKCWDIHCGNVLATFDLQSQVKYLSISRISEDAAVLSSTTKTGAIAILYIRKKLSHIKT